MSQKSWTKDLSPPIQYQQGYCEFYKFKFKLTRDVLIPRPETELLVDDVLIIAKTQKSTIVFDIGTGSGNIAISLAKNNKTIKVFATDISAKALEVAKLNAKFHKVEKQIIFLESDLLSAFSTNTAETKHKIDVIVTNLPYIPTARLMYIDPMVTEFEPRVALDGGRDGFELYRKLLDQMKELNIMPKFLIGEIDYTHAEIAPLEVNKRFPQAQVEIKFDLAQKQRILFIKF